MVGTYGHKCVSHIYLVNVYVKICLYLQMDTVTEMWPEWLIDALD